MAMLFVRASSQYFTVGTELATLRGTSTLSFWILTTSTGNDIPWQAPGVTGIEQSGANDDIMWGIVDSTGKIGLCPGIGGDVFVKSTTSINDNLWHHVLLTRDATSGLVEVYVDGVVEASVTRGTGTIGNTFTSIGRVEDSSGTPEPLDGTLDDVRIYSRVLSPDETMCIYLARGEGDNIVYGLVNRYLMNEGYPSQVASGSGVMVDVTGLNDGTPANSPTWAASMLQSRRSQ